MELSKEVQELLKGMSPKDREVFMNTFISQAVKENPGLVQSTGLTEDEKIQRREKIEADKELIDLDQNFVLLRKGKKETRTLSSWVVAMVSHIISKGNIDRDKSKYPQEFKSTNTKRSGLNSWIAQSFKIDTGAKDEKGQVILTSLNPMAVTEKMQDKKLLSLWRSRSGGMKIGLYDKKYTKSYDSSRRAQSLTDGLEF